ncbi:hypothetical protein CHUAL_006424 [Chamberlinius hualienensis]
MVKFGFVMDPPSPPTQKRRVPYLRVEKGIKWDLANSKSQKGLSALIGWKHEQHSHEENKEEKTHDPKQQQQKKNYMDKLNNNKS